MSLDRNPHGFTRTELHNGRYVMSGRIPGELMPSAAQMDALWEMHPMEFRLILIHGQWKKIPRWQEAFGRDYDFSGQTAKAKPVPPILEPFLTWSQWAIDDGLNGMLLNWYDGSLGHYIGPHHDDDRQLLVGNPIVTISLGEERVFRLLREEKRDGKTAIAAKHDIAAKSGSVIIIPWDTNQSWKHCVPKRTAYRGHRISITLRAFR